MDTVGHGGRDTGNGLTELLGCSPMAPFHLECLACITVTFARVAIHRTFSSEREQRILLTWTGKVDAVLNKVRNTAEQNSPPNKS
jgi:hypothetical protein